MGKANQKISADVLKMLILKDFASSGVVVELEHKFSKTRRWRIDVAVWGPSRKIAIELEGGVYTKGRHTNPTGFLKDMEKYNELSKHGFYLLRYAHVSHQYFNILADLKFLI
jgi:hypothetical protein